MSLFIYGGATPYNGRSPRSIDDLAKAVFRYAAKHNAAPSRVSFTAWAPYAHRLYDEALEAQAGNRGMLHVRRPLFVHDVLPICGGRGILVSLSSAVPEAVAVRGSR